MRKVETGEQVCREGQVTEAGGKGVTAGQEGGAGCGSEVTETSPRTSGGQVENGSEWV